MGLDVATFLESPLFGASLAILRPADLQECGPGTLVWVKSFSESRLQLLEAGKPALAICDPETARKTGVPHVVSRKPRLDFIRALAEFFPPVFEPGIHRAAIVESGALVGRNVSIGAFSYVGKQVSIGDKCHIGSGVVLEGPVVLGNRCTIKSNSVLGGQGFGFEYDESGSALPP